MTDFELLNYKIGDMSLDEMTAITFLGWVAKKINGLEAKTPTMNELSMLVISPPMGRMSIERKIEIIRKMEGIGIEIK